MCQLVNNAATISSCVCAPVYGLRHYSDLSVDLYFLKFANRLEYMLRCTTYLLSFIVV
jgi:hypothetical protein